MHEHHGAYSYRSQRGFALIEMVIVIIVIGVVVAVALRSGTHIVDTARTEQAKRELEALAFGVAGNPALQNNGVRSDFGYVGDIGALPANLDALVINPGYGAWDGPYVSNEFTQLANDYKTDPWGNGYGYAGDRRVRDVRRRHDDRVDRVGQQHYPTNRQLRRRPAAQSRERRFSRSRRLFSR
jgi:prepilin-type N-terminal cleavage/methylation domain-containing protein